MHHRDKIIGLVLSIFGAITVVLGAWGAHGLQNAVNPQEYKRFEIGFFYQVFHLLVLITIWSSHKISSRIKPWIYRLMGLGIFFFSGSLYLLSAASLRVFEIPFLGLLTPVGGFFFILGWFALGWGVLKKTRG
jgi:uncharacterized membrane protein YgdD (TMEM256/DUF423 family)